MQKIDIKQDLKALNNQKAAENRNLFSSQGIYVINMMGSPGAGKTTLLESILPQLNSVLHTAVIEGDLATQNDALRIQKTGTIALQINTNGGCHLDAKMIGNQLQKLDLGTLQLLIIENVGNLVCPATFDLGEDMRMVVLSLAEGEDKPVKYPVAFLNAITAVITKTDLSPYLDANTDVMKQYIADINPKVLVFEAGKKDGVYSAERLVEYIIEQVKKKQST
ncbi:MAG: hydrogenase nickel incorporation protein HypB [Thermoclostridium sp.]|nr:hydrogenase nickel incorporation protein HypB [Thermoclostridium sp.]